MTIDPRFYDLTAHLWRGGKYSYFWSPQIDSDKYSYWLTVAGDTTVPKIFLEVDAYYGVNPSMMRRSEHERARITDIGALNCLYVEFDCKTPEDKAVKLAEIDTWQHKPACVVDSGGGLHVYLWTTETLTLSTEDARQHAIDLQYAFVEMSGGDDGAKDLARVLRIPGTQNRKSHYAPHYPTVSIVRWFPTITHEWRDLEAVLKPWIDARKASETTQREYSALTVSLSDSELLDVLFRSKNGALYQRLWAGDYSMYTKNGRPDHSAGDQVLCNGLAWLTGRDLQRIDSLFRQSGMMRDKWNRDDYRQDTLKNAVNSAQTIYEPRQIDLEAERVAEAAIGTSAARKDNMQDIEKLLLSEGADDEGNAQCVFALHGQNFAHCDAYGYLYYNGRFWDDDGAEAKLQTAIVETLHRRRVLAAANNKDPLIRATKKSSSNVRNCLYLLKRLITVSVNIFDANPELLNCKNGVVNLRTGVIEAHTPLQKFTYCVPVDYNQTADYTFWLGFLARVTPAPNMIEYLQMAAGYSATGYTREECLFYIHGPTRSGKGTFAETILAILPKPLGVEVDFSTFTAKREADTQNFDLAPLKPARFIVASESNKYDSLNEAKIKAATGGNWIRCAFKHRDHFEYRPQFKIWLTSNHPIKGDVDDDALWGRVKVIEFPNSFLGREDKTLKQRMQRKENLEGVLRWIVEGARAWFSASNGLTTPQAVTDATTARRRDLDYIQQWLDQCCKIDPTAWTSNSDIRTSYEAWCKQEGITAKQAEQLSRSFNQKGFAVGVRRTTPIGKQERGVEGFSII